MQDDDDYEYEEEDDNIGNRLHPEELPHASTVSPQDEFQAFDALDPELLIAAIEAQGFRCDGRFLTLNSYENRVYQVGIEDEEPVVAKFYRPDRWSDSQILEEHAFTFELSDAEIPIVAPLRIGTTSLFSFDKYRYAIFPRRGGHAPEFDNPEHLEMLGHLLGRIHLIGAREGFSDRQTMSISFAEANAEFVLQHMISAELKDVYQSICEELFVQIHRAFEQRSQLPVIRIHGDCHLGNFLWRDPQLWIVDLDDCCNGWAMQDIWMLLSGDRQNRSRQIQEFAEAYNEFYDFPTQQLSLIEPLRSLRMINYTGWLARRWQDPAFPHNFPWFNTHRFWSEHILSLREQLSNMDEDPIKLQ